jgi:hypothetical protein
MPTLKERLSKLEERIRALKVDFDRFLNGAIPTPPDELKDDIVVELRFLRSRPITSSTDLFLLNALEARFNSLAELYNRRLREAEIGLAGRPPLRPEPLHDPYNGVVFGEHLSHDAAAALYEELYNSPERRARTDFASFYGFLEQKATTIRNLTGCSQVQFRVDSRDGRLALKAKPVRP